MLYYFPVSIVDHLLEEEVAINWTQDYDKYTKSKLSQHVHLGISHSRHVDEIEGVFRVVVHHEVVELLRLARRLGGKR